MARSSIRERACSLVIMHQQVERIVFVFQVIFHATHNQRAAMTRLCGVDLFSGQQQGSQDSGIQWALSLMSGKGSGKGEEEICGVGFMSMPAINAG